MNELQINRNRISMRLVSYRIIFAKYTSNRKWTLENTLFLLSIVIVCHRFTLLSFYVFWKRKSNDVLFLLFFFSFFSLWRRVRSNSLFDQQKTMRISSLRNAFFFLLFAYRRRCSCSLFFLLFLDQCWCSLRLTWLAGTREENWFSFFFFRFFSSPSFFPSSNSQCL